MTTTTKPRLGRCKECDFALFVADLSQVINVESFREVKGDGRAYRVGNEGFFARCPNRHKFFPLKEIKGTYSPEHKCDARCLNAKGNDCTCSCGGANHGRGHVATVVEASAESVQPVQNAEPATERQVNFLRTLLNEREIPNGDPAHSTGSNDQPLTGEERRENALRKLDAGEFTKRQASATITWLLDLPVRDNQTSMEVGS